MHRMLGFCPTRMHCRLFSDFAAYFFLIFCGLRSLLLRIFERMKVCQMPYTVICIASGSALIILQWHDVLLRLEMVLCWFMPGVFTRAWLAQV